MIKSELVQRLAERNPHLYQRDVEHIVNAVLDEVEQAMTRGDRVELRGFGAFSVKNRPARTGRNPRTGQKVAVTEKAPKPRSSTRSPLVIACSTSSRTALTMCSTSR